MTGLIYASYGEHNEGASQQQQGLRSLWTTPPPRWTHYTLLLALVGILAGTVWAHLQSRPTSIGELVAPPGNINRCDEPVRTWGTVTVAFFSEPGFDEAGTDLRGYWLKDKNEAGIEWQIAVFYDPAKISAPTVGQTLRVSGVLSCYVGDGPERLVLIEQSRTVR
jgi:hypothetical protein